MTRTTFKRLASTVMLATTGILLGLMLASCQKPEERVKDARADVTEAKQELADAQRNTYTDRTEEWGPFKRESEAKIARNTKLFEDFKVKLAESTDEFRDRYSKRADELADRNDELKDKIEDYTDEGVTKRQDFQRSFTHDMDGLRVAIAELPTSRE